MFAREDIEGELRKLLNKFQKQKTPTFSTKILSKWEEKKILQLFDLNSWFKIQNLLIKKTEMALFLWPESLPSKKNKDENANIIDLYNEAMKMMKKVICLPTVQTLLMSSEQERTIKATKQHTK